MFSLGFSSGLDDTINYLSVQEQMALVYGRISGIHTRVLRETWGNTTSVTLIMYFLFYILSR